MVSGQIGSGGVVVDGKRRWAAGFADGESRLSVEALWQGKNRISRFFSAVLAALKSSVSVDSFVFLDLLLMRSRTASGTRAGTEQRAVRLARRPAALLLLPGLDVSR